MAAVSDESSVINEFTAAIELSSTELIEAIADEFAANELIAELARSLAADTIDVIELPNESIADGFAEKYELSVVLNEANSGDADINESKADESSAVAEASRLVIDAVATDEVDTVDARLIEAVAAVFATADTGAVEPIVAGVVAASFDIEAKAICVWISDATSAFAFVAPSPIAPAVTAKAVEV
jgi:hypothetical protein